MHHRSRWTKTEDRLLGTDSDPAIAKRLNRTVSAVKSRRMALRIPGATIGPRNKSRRQWGVTELGMLGRYPDAELARITGRTIEDVQAKRKELRRSK